jgi:hypothetical protein
VFTVLALVLLAGLLALALWQFGRIGQLDRSRWTPFLQLSYLRFLTVGFIGTIVAIALALIYVVVNFVLSQLAVWLERRAGTRMRRNVAGSGSAGTPTRGRLGRTAAAPSTLA